MSERIGSESDLAAVTDRLGREPTAKFEIVVRDAEGAPTVLCNAAFTHDGTPMPTRYWLIGPELVLAVSRLEAAGGSARGRSRGRPLRIARGPR